ncbi:Rid family detoxifying hydrolase [Pseudoalteromonas sp. SMS1]|uniref:RidA family protein n=1 Tax=Pseudoalteromonas sp. SMS1 TaxID=2908894 RepID=UPI001F302EA4|nr:Rid family detoxifying hydrolase [Pseudoalteromonas sp. SMS1]MCF2856550.1 Rid family detoxifying hydrolase [Pseudoalteromonas sp. SMS1]
MKKCAVAVILTSLIAGLSHAEPQAKSNIEFLNSYAVLPAGHNLPFSEAVKVNDKVYLSGQIGIQPGTTKLVAGGIGPESKQTMENIRASLNAHGLSMKDIFKCTIMLADIKEWPEFNKVYTKFFSRPYPARSAFSTNGLALGARVEVECIATVPA